MHPVVIYHNPNCGTSRNVLALIRNTGQEPLIIDYVKTPMNKEQLRALITQMKVPVREVLREKGTPYAELGLGDTSLSEDALLDAVATHPILLNRPIVTTERGTRLCRPSEAVLDLLSRPQLGSFSKEDGEAVVNAQGERVANP